ncbi:MAG TPA: HAMP domain-containing sensor histidine kinase [Longimicrobiales bacterium]|nr:HAMP domain-containing sensor histidine kinase [Longimicrobiales bacterium]
MKTSRISAEWDPPPGSEEAPPPPEDPPAGPGDRELSTAAIEAAAERIRDSLLGREDIPLPDGTSAEDLLESVHRDLVARLGGAEPPPLPDLAEAPGRLRIAQLLQSELIHIWARLTGQPPSRGEILLVLSHLDQMIVSLEPHGRDRVMAMVEAESPLTMVVQLAHDLRSPLTSVLFLAELLQRGRSGPVNETQQRQLGVIYSAAFALVAVANDVIELARGGGTKLTAEDPAPFSLAECLGQIREMLQPMAEDKGIELRIVTPRDDRRVGHPSAISRALLNLATNALKFTEEGFVEVAAEPSGWEGVRFTVTDSGRGMSPDAERNLFQPFQKSERRKGVFFSGSGLGLSIVRRIVDDLGGELTYETRLHHGTRFEFTLRLPSAQDLRG